MKKGNKQGIVPGHIIAQKEGGIAWLGRRGLVRKIAGQAKEGGWSLPEERKTRLPPRC